MHRSRSRRRRSHRSPPSQEESRRRGVACGRPRLVGVSTEEHCDSGVAILPGAAASVAFVRIALLATCPRNTWGVGMPTRCALDATRASTLFFQLLIATSTRGEWRSVPSMLVVCCLPHFCSLLHSASSSSLILPSRPCSGMSDPDSSGSN